MAPLDGPPQIKCHVVATEHSFWVPTRFSLCKPVSLRWRWAPPENYAWLAWKCYLLSTDSIPVRSREDRMQGHRHCRLSSPDSRRVQVCVLSLDYCKSRFPPYLVLLIHLLDSHTTYKTLLSHPSLFDPSGSVNQLAVLVTFLLRFPEGRQGCCLCLSEFKEKSVVPSMFT